MIFVYLRNIYDLCFLTFSYHYKSYKLRTLQNQISILEIFIRDPNRLVRNANINIFVHFSTTIRQHQIKL